MGAVRTLEILVALMEVASDLWDKLDGSDGLAGTEKGGNVHWKQRLKPGRQ